MALLLRLILFFPYYSVAVLQVPNVVVLHGGPSFVGDAGLPAPVRRREVRLLRKSGAVPVSANNAKESDSSRLELQHQPRFADADLKQLPRHLQGQACF